MKKIISSIILFSWVCLVHAQQVYPIKESYDQILEPYYSGIDYNNTSIAWWEG